MVEKIEVLKGGQSLFYGTSAISGAINIVTKGFSDELQRPVQRRCILERGRHISGYTSGSVGDHSFVVFASHDEADGFQPFRDQDYQPSATDRNRGYNVTNLGAKYGYEFSPGAKVSVNYTHTDATLDFANAYRTTPRSTIATRTSCRPRSTGAWATSSISSPRPTITGGIRASPSSTTPSRRRGRGDHLRP